jgi:hypothetical protein
VLGVLGLFQATYPLLEKSTSAPKFIPISSVAGSVTIGPTFPLQTAPYVIFLINSHAGLTPTKVRRIQGGVELPRPQDQG